MRRCPQIARLAFLLGIVFLFAGCSRAPDAWKGAKAGQKRVLATFPPLYCLTHAVAGGDAYVLCFLNSEGPHEYKFSPLDAVKAKGADLLIYNGLELDDKLVEGLNGRAKVPALNTGKALPEKELLPMGDDDDDEKDAKHGDKEAKPDHHHHHGVYDPHVWLGLPEAIRITDAIGAKLAAIDPAHADGYKQRAGQLKEELAKLLADGQARFKAKKSRKIVTMHDSIGYFARAFDLEVIDSIQVQPGDTPDNARLAQLETKCKQRGVDVITYEPQYNKAQPELLQQQLKNRGFAVRLVEFDPLETAPLKGEVNPDPDFYLDTMRANIDHLVKALP